MLTAPDYEQNISVKITGKEEKEYFSCRLHASNSVLLLLFIVQLIL